MEEMGPLCRPRGAMGQGSTDRLTLLPRRQPLTSVFKILTYQPSWEARASRPRAAGHRTEPWTAAHLGPVRAQRWSRVHSHPASIFQGARASSPLPLPSHQESGGEGGVGAPVPGVCEPFYPWVLWFPASFLQGSSWLRPARNSDMWGRLRTLSCPRPAQHVTKPQDVRAGRRISCSLNSLPAPNSLIQIGKLRPAGKICPRSHRVRHGSQGSRAPALQARGAAPQSGPQEAARAFRLTGRKRQDRPRQTELGGGNPGRLAPGLGGMAAAPRTEAQGPANEKPGKKGMGTSASGKGAEPAGRAVG